MFLALLYHINLDVSQDNSYCLNDPNHLRPYPLMHYGLRNYFPNNESTQGKTYMFTITEVLKHNACDTSGCMHIGEEVQQKSKLA